MRNNLLDSKFIEEEFLKRGLIDVSTLIPALIIDLKYSTKDNFVGEIMYGDLKRAYLNPEVAEMLNLSHRELKRRHPDYEFCIYDAARPLSIQEYMFDLVKGGPNERYVANPYNKSAGYHNYGLAIDLTICDASGNPLDMGSGFDSFNDVSHSDNDSELFAEGQITAEAVENRQLLREIMCHVQFSQNPYEWWHFQLDFGTNIPNKYVVLDF